MPPISKYFHAEKSESLLFIAVGVAAIAIGLYFYLQIKTPYHKGLAISLSLIALIQLTVGSTVFVRSPKDIVRVQQIVEKAPERIRTEEIPRMKTVMKNFVLYRYVELALLLIGIVLAFAFAPQTFWKGIGLGLALQSGIMLLLDYFAEKRGQEYMEYLSGIG